MEEKIEEFKEDLEFFEDDLQKYEFIIDLGKKLPPFDESEQVDENLVYGCTSQVWLITEIKDGKYYFKGTSDALIVKGLVYIVTEIFSGHTKEELESMDFNVINELNLSEIITPTRQSGVAGMIKKIKDYANG